MTPNAAYDEAVQGLVRGVLGSEPAMAAVREFVDAISSYGAANSLSQLALRLASPGVPDIYQGCESWSFRLVDPDNRRPVDHAALIRMASELKQERASASPDLASELLKSYTDGRIKLHVLGTGLRIRRQLPSLFLEGIYGRARDLRERGRLRAPLRGQSGSSASFRASRAG